MEELNSIWWLFINIFHALHHVALYMQNREITYTQKAPMDTNLKESLFLPERACTFCSPDVNKHGLEYSLTIVPYSKLNESRLNLILLSVETLQRFKKKKCLQTDAICDDQLWIYEDVFFFTVVVTYTSCSKYYII